MTSVGPTTGLKVEVKPAVSSRRSKESDADHVLDGVRLGVRTVKGVIVAETEIAAETPFWAGEGPGPCLDFDSLDLLELVIFLETELGWQIPEEEIGVGWLTVGDLAAAVMRATGASTEVADG